MSTSQDSGPIPSSPGPAASGRRVRDDADSWIAVVGTAGRFPQATNVDELWQLLLAEREAVTEIPASRWDTSRPLDPTVVVPTRAGLLGDIRTFDPQFFGISPREAQSMDPQQRIMLEVCWETLENAGVRASSLRGSRTGVYVGALWHDYETLGRNAGVNTQYTSLGQALDVIAGRLSYVLGLTGPSLTVQTGCSSALVALHLGVQALRTGEIDGAVIGGVNLLLAPEDTISITHFGGLSPDGSCHAFGAQANGYVRGEGAVSVYLKRYADAVADGDRVLGVIVDTAVNNDAGGGSLAAPNPDGQRDLLRTVYGDGIVPLDQLSYVEAHGTGTFRGDPIEAGAIGDVLGRARSDAAGPLLVGSVKSNIGHLESAAGLAGLVKAMLVLQNRLVPRSLHSQVLNPDIDFDGLRLQVPQELTPLPADGTQYAGVNSFGWSGTNAHVLLRTAPPPVRAAAGSGSNNDAGVLVPVSAHTPAALTQRLTELADHLDVSAHELAETAATLAVERDHFPHRAAVLVNTSAQAAADLRTLAADPDAPVAGAAGTAIPAGKTCFVLPGQGSQWPAMGARLYADEPVFRAEIDRCAAALAPFVDWDPIAALTGTDQDWLEHVDMVQPTLWAMSLGIAALWRAAGVTPDVVIGHSQGEVTAATIAGILTYEDGARIVAERSRLATRASGRGRMLAVDLPIESAREWLQGFEEQISIAVNNGSRSCVLSGDTDEILLLQELLEADGVFCRLVRVDYASHCHHMDPLLAPLVEAVTSIEPRDSEIVFVSSVAERVLPGSQLGAQYWSDNLRRPVMFLSAMEVAVDLGVTHFVEISPHPVQNHAISTFVGERSEQLAALTSLRRDEGSAADFRRTLAAAYVAGLEPFGDAAERVASGRVAATLPGYPWQRSEFWTSGGTRHRGEHGGLDLVTTPAPGELDTQQARTRLDLTDLPWLVDHQVHTATVFPGVGMLALAANAARSRTGNLPGTFEDARFRREISVGDAGVDVAVVLAEDLPGGAAYRLDTLDGVWATHATARLTYEPADLSAAPALPADLVDGPGDLSEAFYARCSERGLHYGPAFQGIQELWATTDTVLARVSAPTTCRPTLRAGEIHPAVWDACLQPCLSFVTPGVTVVPTRIARTQLALAADAVLDEAWALARRHPDGSVDVVVYDAQRRPVLTMSGIELAVLDAEPTGDTGEVHLRLDWTASAEPDDADAPLPSVAVVGADAGTEALADALAMSGVPLAEPDAARCVVFRAPTAAEGLAAQRAGLADLATLARRLGGAEARLVVVTVGARPDGSADADPGANLYWGFGRVLRREQPGLDVRLLDVPDALTSEAVRAELVRDDHEDQVVRLPDGQRLVGRVVQGLPADPVPVERVDDTSPGARGAFRLRPARSGLVEDAAFRPLPRPAPEAGCVEVAVSAAALNFIDVMKTIGTYPDASAGADLLGGECVGTVVRLGADVDPALLGRRVAACAFGAIGTHVTVRADHTAPVPAHLTDAEAASLPLVCATAWYGLVDVGRLAAGDTVLVHSAAGGLGLAALLLARSRGAEVIATAGTEAKRDMLRGLGVAHVFDSRSLSWVDGVRAATGGRGVDIVLNSLAGAHIEAGLQSLAEDGRFVEVGKKDIYANRRVGLQHFTGATSFAAVDIAGLMSRRPEKFARLLADVWEAVADGVFAALPVTTYPFADAGDALRDMTRGVHTGKLVLHDPSTVTRVEPQALHDGRFRDDGTYLITGGLGALGLSLASFLVEHGARSLALLGRSPATGDAAAAVEALRERGAQVSTHAVDVADRGALATVLAEVRAARPLIGVVHAAGILDDALIESVTPEQIERVLRPKIDGGRHLDVLTADDPLDLFVTFSSVAGLVGNPGQAAYAAANVFLDGLVTHRRAHGRPGLSVQWGPFEQIGLAAADSVRGDRLADRGLTGFVVDDAWPGLLDLLAGERGVMAYAPLQPRLWFDAYPDTAAQPSWQAVRAASERGGTAASGEGFVDVARTLDPAELDARIHAVVRSSAGRVLRLDEDSIDPRTPFKALGLDSLMGLELRNRLEGALGVRLSPTLLWTYGSVDALVEPLRQMVLDAVEATDTAAADTRDGTSSPELVDS